MEKITSPDEIPAKLSLDQLDAEASVAEIVAGFVPPPRFAHVSFDNYRPDRAYPSQQAALDALRTYIADLHQEDTPRPGLFGFRRKPAPAIGPRGLYLDGGYGVGKTHLLASAYSAAPGPKAYLSFQELAYIIGAMGMQACLEAFARYRLVCVDEFELDDVGNTMLAKTFITNLTAGRTRIITTSNTLPSDLGRGRFAAEDFKREIGQIATVFQIVRIEGEDYRHRTYAANTLSLGLQNPLELQADFEAYAPPNRAKLYTTFADLTARLAELHPIRYSRLLGLLDALYIEGLAPMDDQNIALRLVHLIDKLYDQGLHFRASALTDLPDLFSSEYRDKGYAKKYRRCLSRLHELLQEQAR